MTNGPVSLSLNSGTGMGTVIASGAGIVIVIGIDVCVDGGAAVGPALSAAAGLGPAGVSSTSSDSLDFLSGLPRPFATAPSIPVSPSSPAANVVVLPTSLSVPVPGPATLFLLLGSALTSLTPNICPPLPPAEGS